jgi:hypothetical protein
MLLPTHLLAQIWKVGIMHWSLLDNTWDCCEAVEALNPHRLVPPSQLNIWEVIHMLWMGIWTHHHAVTNTFVGPDLTKRQKAWVTVRYNMRLLCSGWGSKPTWIGSLIPSEHMKCDWQPSYAVDGDMDPSSCCYQHICWPSFNNKAKSIGHCWTPNETVVQWLRL